MFSANCRLETRSTPTEERRSNSRRYALSLRIDGSGMVTFKDCAISVPVNPLASVRAYNPHTVLKTPVLNASQMEKVFYAIHPGRTTPFGKGTRFVLCLPRCGLVYWTGCQYPLLELLLKNHLSKPEARGSPHPRNDAQSPEQGTADVCCETICIQIPAREPILAVGGELKSAVCVLKGNEAVLSEPVGDLSVPENYRTFLNAVEGIQHRLGVRPEIIAYDLHPEYAATRYALSRATSRGLSRASSKGRNSPGNKTIAVQHHHAHVVSCMVENALDGEVIGVACDGTGYGADGTIWGCEVLICDEADFRRTGHLRTFPLPGGDAAAIETWRPAAGLLVETFGEDWPDAVRPKIRRIDPQVLALTRSRLASPNARIIRTSSLGRLFDGVAFLLGICDRNDTEARAPIALEARAGASTDTAALGWALNDLPDGEVEMDFRPMIREIIDGGRGIDALAGAFHETAAAMLAGCVGRIAERTGLDRVVLSGGCFANHLLLGRLVDLLRSDGRDVYVHHRISAGDAGIALGQAVVAATRIAKGVPQ